jgi:hypothetical protein
MTQNDHIPEPETSQDNFVTAVLEPDQLSEAHKKPVPRRQLRGPLLLVLWLMRIYLLFMIAVVVYQVWSGLH